MFRALKIIKILAFLLMPLHLSWAGYLGSDYSLSPFWDWKTLETDHFRITFPAELFSQAKKSAEYFEEAHATLSKFLLWEPKVKTQVLITDHSDIANGVTAPVLRIGIVLFMATPENWESIAYEDDWLKLLIFHEYSHFLNMDPTPGAWKYLRYVFGDAFLPNSFWPIWMLEGLAVYVETSFTKVGRGRSPLYEGILRSAVEENVLGTSKFVTLDKIFGDNPRFPGGETAYLFGYYLMNELAHTPPLYEKNIGELSYQSSYRIPYFINGNLENLIQKDWPTLWSDWLTATYVRMRGEIAKIKSQPLTPIQQLTEKGSTILGQAVSPDGTEIAYTQDSSDKSWGLYLKNLKSGVTQRLENKILGATMAWTPDSQFIVYSRLNRKSQYYLWNDLAAYDFKSKKSYALTESLRAKDPDISPDGKWVVFVLSETAKSVIALAGLKNENGELRLGEVQKLFFSDLYGRVSTPKFSRDGKKIIFSQHSSRQPSEEIVEFDLSSQITKILVQNGHFNRFPAFDFKGDLYFVSDLSGVDNIYQVKFPTEKQSPPVQMSNVISGLRFPSFGREGVYASWLSTEGWNLAKIELAAVKPDTVSVHPQNAPPIKAEALASQHGEAPASLHGEAPASQIKDYSIFPSIWPRQWSPLFTLDSAIGYQLGGEVFGFDAVDRHRYLLTFGYVQRPKKLDGGIFYSNRSLGPEISYSFSHEVTAVSQLTPEYSFIRRLKHNLSVAYSFKSIQERLTPQIGLNVARNFQHTIDSTGSERVEGLKFIPTADFQVSYSSREVSRLAITPEGGRQTQFGSRVSLNSGAKTWKALVSDVEYISLRPHHVLVPFLRGSWASHLDSDSGVAVSGNVPKIFSNIFNLLSSSSSSTSLDALTLRGYPGLLVFTRAVGVFSLDYRFPISAIFRGLGTYPFFINHLFGFVFGESAYFLGSQLLLPSVGAGVRLSTEVVYRVPLVFSLEYQQGLNKALGGKGDVILGLNLTAFEF